MSGSGAVLETFEPEVPVDWPEGHVSVEQTDLDHDECFKVTIHGVDHYLHATTLFELLKMIAAELEDWDVGTKSRGGIGVIPEGFEGVLT